MKTRDVTRRGFLSGLAGAGLATPVLGRSATVGVQPDASNFPLVVTSKKRINGIFEPNLT